MKKILAITTKNGTVYRVIYDDEDMFNSKTLIKKIEECKERFFEVIDDLFIEAEQIQSIEIHDLQEEEVKSD